MGVTWIFALTALWVTGMVMAYLLHRPPRQTIAVPARASRLTGGPLISVIVPARNEARNIRRCVQALLDQDYANYELIVVDDRSTDATPQILAELAERSNRLRIVKGKEPPAGWAGKPHALTLGAARAQGEWLCFVDADTFAGPGMLAASLETALVHRADLFTMLTAQELETFWEKTILPLVFSALAFGFPAEKVNDPRQPDAIANGQFILIRKEVYDAVGGHASVWDEIAEDKALAERVKRLGFRLIVADGRKAARTRMYTSLEEIWEGWTKNIYLGMRDRLGLLLLGAVTGLIASLALPAWGVGSAVWLALDPGIVPALAMIEILVLWGYLLALRVRASIAFGISPWYALTLPLGALLFTGMMFTSAFNSISGRGVRWKGRVYQPGSE